MASADVLAQDLLLPQIEKARVELREKVARAHQVLQEREKALLSELQQIENNYREEIEIETNLETPKIIIRQVELEWDENLKDILSRIGLIRVGGIWDNEEYNVEYNVIVSCESTKTSEHTAKGDTFRGLRNLGNTCYMNCILQCLSHTLPLRQLYVTDEYRHYLKDGRGNLSHAFRRVMVELWSTTYSDSVAPHDLKKEMGITAPMFSDYRQHDAHEFMRSFLNELHNEFQKTSVEGRKSPADNESLGEARVTYLTWEDSRISELFSGMLRSEVCCSICSNQSIVYIPFMDIALPIPERIQRSSYRQFMSFLPVELTDCLDIFLKQETLIEEERPYCNVCREPTRSTKQVSIAKLPKFLVIQLKRFSNNPKRTKLSTRVNFNETWELKDNTTHEYSLYGIVCHDGHYTAYCNYNVVWTCFNDSVVNKVSWEHVKDQEAYILFYTKKEQL